MKIEDVRKIKSDYKKKWRTAISEKVQSYNYNRYMNLHQMLKVGGVKVED